MVVADIEHRMLRSVPPNDETLVRNLATNHRPDDIEHSGDEIVDVNNKENHDMAKSRKTSAGAARAASKVLRDGRTGAASKSAAGSALSQRAPKRGK